MKMTEKEKLICDITTVRKSINRDWADLSSLLSLSHDDRTAIRAHIEQCVQDLKELTDDGHHRQFKLGHYRKANAESRLVRRLRNGSVEPYSLFELANTRPRLHHCSMQIREATVEDAVEACQVVRRSIAELCHADHQTIQSFWRNGLTIIHPIICVLGLPIQTVMSSLQRKAQQSLVLEL